ncbi:acriflavin resistance protein [Thiocapsa imhoffii]|uniref:Acriflavin resistance protein n=1 Tax=Thiocapsa imhoffii TaxID=382777 RepID=A0A9X0WIT2_9GAMM|nr:efflux RND transporter permease subunit [Thiocapsa imhoffii]MBK1645353.1 acriflavin resistance protein [Thiocapsa imhoffii]
MTSIVRFTLRQRVLFNVLFVLIFVAGIFALDALPTERYPEVNFGKVVISTIYPGASPSDVEALVTREIERALDGLEDVEFIRAKSQRERSSLTVKFRDDSDYELLYNELRFRVLSALERLPSGIDPPRFDLVRTSFWLPVVTVNLMGERSNRALALIGQELQLRLAQIPGVAEVRLDGEQRREFHIMLDPWKLKANGISFDHVAAALQDANVTLPAGQFSDESGDYLVRVDERFRSREQVVQTKLRRDADGSFLTLEDVIADARLDYRTPIVMTSANGIDAVALRLLKSPQGSAISIYAAAQAIVAEFAPQLAQEGIAVTFTQDSTTYIKESLQTLGWNLIVGILLVSLILWLVLGVRNAGLVTIGIPFAYMVTMVLMQLTGNSLNEITLFSFVLVSGIIVDDAIVVVENIYRRVQSGQALEQAIIDGTAEVAWPVISSSLTTIAAFLPMLIMTGSTGEFFALIPKAVTFAIIASLFECLLILPIHYLDFGPRGPAVAATLGIGRGRGGGEGRLMPALRALTQRLVGISLRFRMLSLGVVLVAFITAVTMFSLSITGSASFVRIQFFPDDYTTYYAFIEGPPETPIADTHERVKAVARFIMDDGPSFARSAAGYAGFQFNEDYEEDIGQHLGMVMVALPLKGEQGFDEPLEHLEWMRQRLVAEFAQPDFRVTVRPQKDGPPTGKDINVEVVGTDEQAVQGLASILLERLRNHPDFSPHLRDLSAERARPARVFRLAVDAARAQEFGLTAGDAARLAASVLDGRYIGYYRLHDEEVDLKLRVDPSYLRTPEAALDIPVLERADGSILLGDVLRPSAEIQPGELARYQRQRSQAIAADIAPGAPISSAQVVAWFRSQYQDLQAEYPGANLVFGGAFEETQRSFDSLLRAFGLAVLLIYLILATQFKSYSQPLIIISAVVFSIIGVVFGKVITQSLFTVNSFIAVVGVTGVVVNDALLLIEFINRRYRDGMTRHEAIRAGVDLRLRPILLTTLTTTLGLLPMAIGFPNYSVIWGSMASTFVTGLATATLLTLFIVPVIWDLLTEWQERRQARRLAKAPTPAPGLRDP